uniref:VWFA domain-containing protein n=1 Tax=Strongyloides venezuelensis TaxID=75913 RepID=A0A0K0F0I9_STRVS
MVLISYVYGDCTCGEIQPNPVTTSGQSAFLLAPEDSSGKFCIPSQDCTYQFAYIVSDNIAIAGNVFNIKNFNSSGATLSFYDGNTASGTPYMVIDGSYDDSKAVDVVSSLGKNITIVFSVQNKGGSIPSFTYVAKSTNILRTTTLPPTTTTPIPTSPYPIVPDSFQSEGDIFIYVDLSANLTLLSQVGGDIINALYINTDYNSFSSRIYFTMASDTTIYPYGWMNSKTFLQKQINNLPEFGIQNSTIEWAKFGVILDAAFKDSLTQRPNVQRTLILLTDKDNQIADQDSSPYQKCINQYDIHPVIINIDLTKDVSTFKTIPGIFNGANTNQIVKVNYNNVTDLYENYLFNSNVMCNINSLSLSGKSEFQFPVQDQGATYVKNYCNYMNYTIKCASSNNASADITVALNNYDLEANADFLKVYNDQGIIQAVFTGTLITNSQEVIKSTTFVELVISTNNHRVYPGVNIKFTGCIIV